MTSLEIDSDRSMERLDSLANLGAIDNGARARLALSDADRATRLSCVRDRYERYVARFAQYLKYQY